MIKEFITGFGQTVLNIFGLASEFNETLDELNSEETPFYTFPKEELDKIDSLNPHLLEWEHTGSSYNPYKYPLLVENEIPIINNGVSGSYPMNGDILKYNNDVSSNWGTIDDVSNDLVEKLWKKMYEKPVIVRCGHCNSHNIITNPTCIQCGAPMGDYKMMRAYG